MNILDENIFENQRQLFKSWRISIRQIGVDMGRKGMLDEEIIPFLHTLKQPTLFTCDAGFYEPSLCHAGYCLVYIPDRSKVASLAREFLNHPDFDTKMKRMGTTVRLTPHEIQSWRLHREAEMGIKWSPKGR